MTPTEAPDSPPLDNPPFVTVITATFNAAKTLPACLESVYTQGYPFLEHIVIDGASTDGTVKILQQQTPANSWISEPDHGIYDAWNKGLERAAGDWICFLGADDMFLPGAISSYMRLAKANPGAEFLSSRVRWIGRRRTRVIGERWSWPRFQRSMITPHVGAMHRRSLFERYGLFDDKVKIVGDYEFLLRAGANLKAAYTPDVTVEMLSGGASHSLAAIREASWVKVATGKRPHWRAAVERVTDGLRFRVGQLLG